MNSLVTQDIETDSFSCCMFTINIYVFVSNYYFEKKKESACLVSFYL